MTGLRSPLVRPGALALPALLILVPGGVLVAMRGFDGLYGQDAFAYTDYALGPLRDAVLRLEPPPPFPWPPGYPLLMALSSLVIGAVPLAGQAVSLAAGALLALLTGVLAVWLLEGLLPGPERHAAGMLAGTLIGVAGHVLQSSIVTMADTSAAAAATAGALCAVRWATTHGLRWLILAAAALALAIEIRVVYGFVALVVATASLSSLTRRPSRQAVTHAASAAAMAMVVLLPTLVPMATARLAGTAVPFTVNFDVFRWDLANAVSTSFATADGRLEFVLPSGLFYLLQPFQPYWLWPMAVFIAPGLVAVMRRPTIMTVALLVAWPVFVVGFLAGGAYQNTRFFLAAAPPIAILAALGVVSAWRFARGLSTPRRHLTQRAVVVAVALGLMANAGAAVRFTDNFIARQTADLAAIRSLAALVPTEAHLASLGATPPLRHDGRAVIELAGLEPPAALDLAAGGLVFLLIDERSIRVQWVGRTPGLTLSALERAHGLQAVAKAGSWTLFLVGSDE